MSIKYENEIVNGVSFGTRVSGVVGNGKEEKMEFLDTPFFDSTNDGYTTINELYLKGAFGNSELVVGRQKLDLPFIDSNDDHWGLIPDRYEAVLFTNKDIKDTALTLAHVRSWSGVDSPEPENFNKLNGSSGMNVLGVEYSGIEHLTLKAYGYYADNFLSTGYTEADYQSENALFQYSLSAQYALQKYHDAYSTNMPNISFDLPANLGDTSSTLGFMVDLKHKNSGLEGMFSYNRNISSGIANVLYGAGPFFTSTEFYTVTNLEGKGSIYNATLSYDASAIINGLGLQTTYARLNRDSMDDAQVLDGKISYVYNNNLDFKLVYSKIQDKLNGNLKDLRAYVIYKF